MNSECVLKWILSSGDTGLDLIWHKKRLLHNWSGHNSQSLFKAESSCYTIAQNVAKHLLKIKYLRVLIIGMYSLNSPHVLLNYIIVERLCPWERWIKNFRNICQEYMLPSSHARCEGHLSSPDYTIRHLYKKMLKVDNNHRDNRKGIISCWVGEGKW